MSIKRNQLLNIILLLYILISMAILYFEIGGTRFGLVFTSFVTKTVPSITPTAAITQTPDSSALILSFSWSMVILGTFAMVLIAKWKEIDYERVYKRISWWVIFGMFVIIPSVCLFVMHHVPDESGMYNRFLYSNLKEFKLFILLYGAGIWLCFAAGFFSIIFISICIYFKHLKKG